MDMKEIREFMDSNKDTDDVREFKKSLMPNFDELLQDDEFKKSLESYADSRVSKAVDTYKTKTLPQAVEEAAKKRVEAMNQKTPEQIKYEELERKVLESEARSQKIEREKLIEANKNIALKFSAEKKLPTDVLDFFVSDEEEVTKKNLNLFSTMMENHDTNIKQEFMSGNNTKIPGNKEVFSNGIKEPGENATPAEWDAWYLASRK